MKATVIALAVAPERADAYGDMLTEDVGHLEHRSRPGLPGARGWRSDRAGLVGARGMASGSRAL